MKALLLTLSLLLSFSSFAISKGDLEKLLAEKNLTLGDFQNSKVLLGEVTGAGKSLPFSKVAVIVTEQEAILSNEIVDVSFKAQSKKLGDLDLARTRTENITLRDVVGIIHSN